MDECRLFSSFPRDLVIPAQAGIQNGSRGLRGFSSHAVALGLQELVASWLVQCIHLDSRFRGNDDGADGGDESKRRGLLPYDSVRRSIDWSEQPTLRGLHSIGR